MANNIHLNIGPFTQFISGQWLQPKTRAGGLQKTHPAESFVDKSLANKMADTHQREIVKADKAVLLEHMQSWQQQLSLWLMRQQEETAVWQESTNAHYHSLSLDKRAYASLVMLACYRQFPKLQRPQEAVSNWAVDPLWKSALKQAARLDYEQLIIPEIWLPYRKNRWYPVTLPWAEEAYIGSSVCLGQQLKKLNKDTFNASDGQLSQLARNKIATGMGFDQCASIGLAQVLEAVAWADKLQQPLMLVA